MNEAGAAVVAAQLLAFYKEPVRYRSRLIHGREPFSGGLLVFRFAHGKFSHALMRDLTAAERECLRVAAAFFIRQVCLWEGATHYQVLCVPTDARRETIKEHYHGLIALLHPDRHEAVAEHWPSGAAQRANQAYAVLHDDELRRRYDSGLDTTEPAVRDDPAAEAPRTVAARTPVVGRFAAARIRMRRPVLIFSAVVASLFFAQIWWFGDLPREYATLAGAAPFDLSSRWVRDVRSGAERPRFIGGAEPQGLSPVRVQEATGEVPVPFLTPLWRALSTRTASVPVVPREADEPRVASAAPAVPQGERQVTRLEPPPQRTEKPAAVEVTSPVHGEPLVIAQAVTPRPAGPKPVAPVPAALSVPALSTADMEMLVARIVTYYESGDLDRLLGLYDTGNIGFWEAIRIRQDFQEFFRTTRARRLRLNRVSWESAALSGRARGDAALFAEYADPPGGKLERNVDLELDVIVREGQPRIARLSLFPHAK